MKIIIITNGLTIEIEWCNHGEHNTKIKTPNGELSCSTDTPQQAVHRALLFTVGQ